MSHTNKICFPHPALPPLVLPLQPVPSLQADFGPEINGNGIDGVLRVRASQISFYVGVMHYWLYS